MPTHNCFHRNIKAYSGNQGVALQKTNLHTRTHMAKDLDASYNIKTHKKFSELQ